MKDSIITIDYFLNGKKQEHTVSPGITLLDMLHQKHKSFGTKKGCKEGDCGACTVAIGGWVNGSFIYQAIASCIYPAIKLHGKHLITIEGLAEVSSLHLIQEKIVNNHGVQCGYCTPGISMSLFCLFAMKALPSEREISLALEGNICRCTGYEGIREAGRAIVEKLQNNPEDWESEILPSFAKDVEEKLHDLSLAHSPKIMFQQVVSKNESAPIANYHVPETLEDLFSLLKDLDNSTIIAGGTDLYVGINAGRTKIENLVDISLIEDLTMIEIGKDLIRFGSQVSISSLIENTELLSIYPAFRTVGYQVASLQIRNAATIAGNIANASPIGDFSVLLLALKASVEIKGVEGRRLISLSDFFINYKETALKKGEIITAVEIPVNLNLKVHFEKSSKRNAVDIASVNSCFAADFKNGEILSCRFAFGGIAPTPVSIYDTDELLGKTLNDQIILAFANRIKEKFPVISDIRGSKEFRTLLIRNHIIKHFNHLMKMTEEAIR